MTKEQLVQQFGIYLPTLGIALGSYFIFNFLPKKGSGLILRTGIFPLRLFVKLNIFLIKTLFFKPLIFTIKKVFNYLKTLKFKKTPLYLTVEQIDKMDLIPRKNGVKAYSGKWFESYVARLYQALGHESLTTTQMREDGSLYNYISKKGGSGEQGVDVIVRLKNKDNFNQVLLIQCKHYGSNVGNDAIQEIVSAKALYKGDGVAVVTNQYFTKSAKELALANGVILIDRDRLQHIINQACSKIIKRENYEIA